ncbi:MAG: SpoIIE family protein phosphatase, partial [Acidobacteriia bacterium]|nr:SpoIIE family protein phosphatase [Terriglobia bacterium]
TVTVERGGRPLDVRLTLRPLPMWRPFAVVCLLVMPWLSIALGFWVAALRPRDLRSWLMLGMLLGLSQVVGPGNLDARAWPLPLAGLSAVYQAFALRAWAVCMMLFGIYFPQRWAPDVRRPWLKWLLVVPLGALALWDALRSAVFTADYAAGARWFPATVPGWIQLLLAAAAVLLFFIPLASKYRDPALATDDRRRLKLLYWGSTAAMAPMFLYLVVNVLVFRRQPQDGLLVVLAFMAMVLFPVTLAYVVVVQRAMDVRMVVRQGVQYTLARGGIRVLQVAVIVGVIFLAVTYSTGTMSRPNRFTLIAFGVFVTIRIRDIGDYLRRWVDRRFFRESYDAERILGELSEQVRSILERDELLGTVARKISESLHVERIAVLLQDERVFRPALARGYAAPPEAVFAGDAPTVNRLRGSREPVVIENRAAYVERKALDSLDSEVLLPLTAKKELLGFISLGPKKSEEPYSSTDTRLLGAVAAQTGLALENSRLSEAIAAEVAQRELMSREIEIAREVQQRLFPQSMPEVPCLQYAGHCRPARGVGGDYYDFLALASGRLGLAIADVSGKGIPAALLMASLQASVRGQSQARDNDIAGLMERVNRLVFDASPENRYATFFYGQFDPATRRLAYVNGGHNPPILLRGEEVIRLETGGPVVGLFRVARYEQGEAQLEPGDLLALYTDGVSEAENPAEEEWGEEALIAALHSGAALPPSELIARVMEAADGFAAGAPQHDDMTLVIARVL